MISNKRGPLGDGNGWYLACAHIYILVVILLCNLATCYHWENWGKGTWDLSVSFLTTAYGYAIIPK
jgi:hypothetical protein